KVQALPGKEFEAVKWGVEIAKLSFRAQRSRASKSCSASSSVVQSGSSVGVRPMPTWARLKQHEEAPHSREVRKERCRACAPLFVPESARDEIWNVLEPTRPPHLVATLPIVSVRDNLAPAVSRNCALSPAEVPWAERGKGGPHG